MHALPVLGSFIFGIVGSGVADIVGNGVGAGVAGGKYLWFVQKTQSLPSYNAAYVVPLDIHDASLVNKLSHQCPGLLNTSMSSNFVQYMTGSGPQ